MHLIDKSEHKALEELTAKLTDHKWRLNNLYYVRDKHGNKVRFKLNDTQQYLIDNMWYMPLIVKARQLGMTTFFSLFYLDQVLFSENKIAGIIAHRQEDMKRIFRGKIVFALENLEPWMKKYIGPPTIDTANEIVFNNGGSIFVSMTARSQTLNFLHISEYGYICAHTPEKADEILNGAINSVHAGQMVSIESTAEGRDGHFYRLAMEAEKKHKEGRRLTPLDFKIFFFPWWWDKAYVLTETDTASVPISKEDKEYFQTLKDKHAIVLSPQQQAWYVKKREMLGDGMFAEFPSTLEEAFSVNLEGAYYAKEMSRVYQERRIGFFPVDPTAEVNVAWDLGMNDQNVLLFYQEIGPEIRFIDVYTNSGHGLEHYVNYIRSKPYRIGRNVLPHDVAVRDLSTGISREQFLWDLGMRNTYVVPKAGIQDGIEKVRMLFPRFRFNEETTKPLTDSLHSYRRDFDTNMGVFKSLPRHDENSHMADAVRTLAMAHQEIGMDVDGQSGVNIVSFFK